MPALKKICSSDHRISAGAQLVVWAVRLGGWGSSRWGRSSKTINCVKMKPKTAKQQPQLCECIECHCYLFLLLLLLLLCRIQKPAPAEQQPPHPLTILPPPATTPCNVECHFDVSLMAAFRLCFPLYCGFYCFSCGFSAFPFPHTQTYACSIYIHI